MKIKEIKRSELKLVRASRSKYRDLYRYLDQLKPGGDLVEVEYDSKKDLNSIRNLVYNYNKTNNVKVKSTAISDEQKIYFYLGAFKKKDGQAES